MRVSETSRHRENGPARLAGGLARIQAARVAMSPDSGHDRIVGQPPLPRSGLFARAVT